VESKNYPIMHVRTTVFVELNIAIMMAE
jgi:hypothetical protein